MAIGDSEIGVALPQQPIIRRPSIDLWSAIESRIRELSIDAFVVGLPLCSDGGDSKWTTEVRKFASALEKRFHLSVNFSDEYYTSKQVADDLPAGRSGRRAAIVRRRSGKDDSRTAALILNDFFIEHFPPPSSS
jgi:putative transcription antitermination factor YqgF